MGMVSSCLTAKDTQNRSLRANRAKFSFTSAGGKKPELKQKKANKKSFFTHILFGGCSFLLLRPKCKSVLILFLGTISFSFLFLWNVNSAFLLLWREFLGTFANEFGVPFTGYICTCIVLLLPESRCWIKMSRKWWRWWWWKASKVYMASRLNFTSLFPFFSDPKGHKYIYCMYTAMYVQYRIEALN